MLNFEKHDLVEKIGEKGSRARFTKRDSAQAKKAMVFDLAATKRVLARPYDVTSVTQKYLQGQNKPATLLPDLAQRHLVRLCRILLYLVHAN